MRSCVGSILLLALGLGLASAAWGEPGADDGSKQTSDSVVPEVLVLPEDLAAATALLSRLSNDQLVGLMRTPRVDLQQVVCSEVIGRRGVATALRREAAEELAGLKGSSADAELLLALYRLDRLSTTDPSVLVDLGEMVVRGDRTRLTPLASTVLRVAKYGRNEVTKECGWAAYVMVLGDADKALTYAKTSTSRLPMLLAGLRRVPDRTLLSPIREQVAEIAREHADPKIRAVALRGLVACDRSEATIDEILPLVNTPPHGFAALAALEEFPVAEFPASRIVGYVEAFVAFAERQTPDRLALIANRARTTWAHARALVGRLEAGAVEQRLATALEGIAVQYVELRTVRRELRFDRAMITVEAGRVVDLRYDNRDDLPQNLVLVKPGTIDEVGAAADAMQGEEGSVPALPAVVASIRLVPPHGSGRLVFVAPTTPGDYHFLSTVAEHWRSMQGTFRIVAPQ